MFLLFLSAVVRSRSLRYSDCYSSVVRVDHGVHVATVGRRALSILFANVSRLSRPNLDDLEHRPGIGLHHLL